MFAYLPQPRQVGCTTGVLPPPSLILFENSYLIYLLACRNKDKVARSVKIIKPDSKLFEVVPNKKFKNAGATGTKTGTDIDVMSSRVAPGMEV